MKKIELRIAYEDFKKIKKGKKTALILPNNELVKEISDGVKITFINDYNKKNFKTKIKKIISGETIINVLANFSNKELGYDKKDTQVIEKIESKYNEEIKEKGFVGIKIKRKKKIFRKIILFTILLFLCIYGFLFIKNTINSFKSKKIYNQIEEIKKDKLSYVVVSINPKIIIELKNDKVINTGCLNNDCISTFKNSNLANKNLKSAIETLYEVAKESGIDVSNVSVFSKENIENKLKDLNYVKYNQIDNNEELNYINQVLDNDNIKNQLSKEDYNKKLLETYQKDSDYGKYYTCVINDELECYLTDEFIEKFSYLLSGNTSEEEVLKKIIANTLEYDPILQRILDKFNVEYKTETFFGIKGITEIKINNNYYTLRTSISTELANVGASFEIEDAEYGIIVLKLQNLNLFNSSYKKEDLIELPIGEVEVN